MIGKYFPSKNVFVGSALAISQLKPNIVGTLVIDNSILGALRYR